MSDQCAWPIVRLGDIITDAAYGTSVKCSDNPEGVPVLRMGNVRYDGSLDLSNLKYAHFSQSEWRKFGLATGDILFNRTNSKELVGKTGLWDGRFKAAAASYFIRIRVNSDRVLPEWVWWFLNSPQMKKCLFATARGAIGQANINGEELRAFPIPLPSLTEQHRIVDILNNAASIRRLRDEARAKVRELVPTLFVEMFGDPATNPKGWPSAMLDDVAFIGSGVTKGRKLEGVETVNVPYLRVANVQDGRLNMAEIKTIPIRLDERAKYALLPGDLVMTEGGDPDKLGRSAIWKGEIDGCVHQNHVFRVRPRNEKVLSDYLCALTSSGYGKAYFLLVAKQTTGIASINRTQLGRFPVLLPPLALQQEFAERITEIEAMAALSDKAVAAAEQLTQSLLAQAFGRIPYRQSVEA
ncbi:type I restriction enzyme S subunit [Azospirillum lipoferum]|uniref:Restriction endonuclease subunit S n=1 Tax=Azospirillum lipoferum TaxID=193 RepID=A0A5A9GHZ6_AZOLI|nr:MULTISPECIES: restriction endonuclease subunit S [Azospirillum]KAA0593966.1 restriction endonuclease subunit S [Azospirillum lipoferum]MCP1612441.1 type I restriction enzyme S subunit [Azospirillum lipoferum]MDW5531775.1 restriction endonuclease subunit S [Azospirillum sp. NL1]